MNLGLGTETASQGIDGPSLMMSPPADERFQLMIARGGKAVHLWLHPWFHLLLNPLK